MCGHLESPKVNLMRGVLLSLLTRKGRLRVKYLPKVMQVLRGRSSV